jgi:hypothetical protein
MPDPLILESSLLEDLPAPHGRACEACGAPVEALDRFCNACGAPQPQAASAAEAAPPGRAIQCGNCGAQISVDPNVRSYTCPFCDSNYVVELPSEQTQRQPPEFVIGFAVSPAEAQEKFRQWIHRNSWFRPGDLARQRVEDKLQGVYLPFWSFSMLAHSRWQAQIGEYWYRTETYTTIENGKTVTRTRQVRETEWWPLSGRHHEFYSGYLVSGSRGLPQRDAERIKPFHLAAAKRYQPHFLAGWSCEEYSVEREAALDLCQREFLRREQEAVSRFLPGDTHSGLRVKTTFSHVQSDLLLLPIYISSYRYHGKVYRFLVNGQTGVVVGDKPISAVRIVLFVLAIVLLVVLAVLGIHLLNAS